MKFGKPKPNKGGYHEDVDFVGVGCAYVLHIGTGKARRYIQIIREPDPRTAVRVYPQHSLGPNGYIRLSPLIRINKKDEILYVQVLKELLLGFKELPEIPSENTIREVMRKVGYKYGEPTDKAQTNFLCSISRLNDKKRKAEKQGLLMEILHKGIRARTLAGKDRQLWRLVKMLEP